MSAMEGEIMVFIDGHVNWFGIGIRKEEIWKM